MILICLKCPLVLINFVLICTGLGLMIAINHVSDFKDVSPKLNQFKDVENLSSTITYGGMSIMIFALTGFYGAGYDKSLALLLYSGLLLLLIIGELTPFSLYLCYKNTLEASVADAANLLFNNYNKTSIYSTTVDVIQSVFECCGTVDNKTPWTHLVYTPKTCSSVGEKPDIYKEGCAPTLTKFIERESTTFMWITVAVAAVLIAVLVTTLNLISRIKSK